MASVDIYILKNIGKYIFFIGQSISLSCSLSLIFSFLSSSSPFSVQNNPSNLDLLG